MHVTEIIDFIDCYRIFSSNLVSNLYYYYYYLHFATVLI